MKKKKTNKPNVKKQLKLQRELQQAYRLQQHNKIREAIVAYQQILQRNPAEPSASQLLGALFHRQGLNEQAAPLLMRAADHYRDADDLQAQTANVLVAIGEYEQAQVYYQRAIRANPALVAAHIGCGNLHKSQQRWQQAISSYNRVLELQPSSTAAYIGLGLSYLDMGDFEQAVAQFNAAIARDPGCAEAHRQLALLKKHREYDDELQLMEALYAKADNTNRMLLAFGLAKAFDDLQDVDKSFSYLVEGNRIMRNSFHYSIQETEQLFSRIRQVFDEHFFSALPVIDTPSVQPVFILGMPRSGTSLVEQILASHSAVFGAGELNTLAIVSRRLQQFTEAPFPVNVHTLTRQQLEAMSALYIDDIINRADGSPVVTDKMPQNFLLIGLIVMLLPNAKIIYCRRDPMDNCFSIFKHWFSGTHAYAYDMTELGIYYRLHEQLMRHWQSVLNGRIITVQYESIVEDTEQQVRQLLTACDLPFERRCLQFYKAQRAVATSSATQVRQPIYTSSLKAWRRFERQLAPMEKALGSL